MILSQPITSFSPEIGAKIESISSTLLEWSTVGWKPTVALGSAGHVTDNWPLANLEWALTIVGAYLLFVLFGLTLMPFLPAVSDRVFYPLKFCYNITQMFLCAYMCVEAGFLAYRNDYTLFPYGKSNPFDAANPPLAKLLWLFYLSKILDFFDTISIVMQKRFNQLSFLHVYHHSSIFLFYWLNLRRGYDGDIFFTIVFNGFIHAVMYTYYFLSMHTKDIWWKKYLTMMQMVQFCGMLTQAGMMMVNDDATFPPRMTQAYFVYIMSILGLFMNFFAQSYMPKKKSSETKKMK